MIKESLNKNVYAVILAGGVGSRFWPFSRELEPKQFMDITGQGSLIQNTIKRLQGIVRPKHIYIISRVSYLYELKRQLKRFRIPESNILLEPEAKSTAPAIGLCARLIAQLNKDAVLVVLPSDHYIADDIKFRSCIFKAIDVAMLGFLVTIGVRPTRKSTGYGYIKIVRKLLSTNRKNNFYKVLKFLEKPTLEKVRRYVVNRDYFWNSGMFIWKASVFLNETRLHVPGLYSKLMVIKSLGDVRVNWHKIKPISVDYGILERSKNVALVPANFIWADLGSWDALNDILTKDTNGNIIQADFLDFDSKRIGVFSRSNRLVATIGLKDLIIADTPDALLVCDRHKTQDIKKLIDRLKDSRRNEHIRHLTEKRPWGSYTVLHGGQGFKIKLIEIEPGKRLSLQSHAKRAEHWVVVSGCAKVKSSRKVRFVYSNQSIYIPKAIKHRLENPTNSPLKIVEIQTGNYLEEDDITRFSDDFMRK